MKISYIFLILLFVKQTLIDFLNFIIVNKYIYKNY